MRTTNLAVKTLLKPSEAADFFDIPLPTIYFWYRMGNIHGIKVNGTCLRIFTESIREFLRSRPTGDRRCHTGHRQRNDEAPLVSPSLADREGIYPNDSPAPRKSRTPARLSLRHGQRKKPVKGLTLRRKALS